MTKVLLAALGVSLLMLTAYVTTKAGWFGAKEERPMSLQTMNVRTQEQIENVMNSASAKIYKAGQAGSWKLAMVYR